MSEDLDLNMRPVFFFGRKIGFLLFGMRRQFNRLIPHLKQQKLSLLAYLQSYQHVSHTSLHLRDLFLNILFVRIGRILSRVLARSKSSLQRR